MTRVKRKVKEVNYVESSASDDDLSSDNERPSPFRPRKRPAALSERPMKEIKKTSTDRVLSDAEASEGTSTTDEQRKESLQLAKNSCDSSAALEVYKAPTAEELVQTRSLIQQEEAQLDKLKIRHSDLLVQLQIIEQQQTLLSKSIEWRRSSISPFHSLPHDILAMIFQSSEDVSPWVWMSMNRMTRAVAMQTRSLWSKILITTDPSLSWSWSRNRWSFGRERCNTVLRLQRALARSAGGKVDIKLFIPYRNGTWLNTKDKAIVNDLITTLETAQFRISSLDLYDNQSSIIESLSLSKFTFSALEYVSLTTKMVSVFQRIQETATALRSLQLGIIPGEKLVWKMRTDNIITIMNLRTSPGNWGETIGPGIYEVISLAKNLSYLILHDTIILETVSKSTLVLPSLEHLVIDNCTLRIGLELPRLEILELSRSRVGVSGQDLVMPCLKELKLQRASEIVKGIKAPKLESLDMQTDVNSFIQLVECSIKKGYMAPRVLTLCVDNSRVDEDDFLTALDSIHSLRDLAFHGTGLRKKFFDWFAGASLASKSKSPRRTPICTQLQRFRLDGTYAGNKNTGKAMSKWLHQAVKVRQNAQYPLDEILFKESLDHEWERLS